MYVLEAVATVHSSDSDVSATFYSPRCMLRAMNVLISIAVIFTQQHCHTSAVIWLGLWFVKEIGGDSPIIFIDKCMYYIEVTTESKLMKSLWGEIVHSPESKEWIILKEKHEIFDL